MDRYAPPLAFDVVIGHLAMIATIVGVILYVARHDRFIKRHWRSGHLVYGLLMALILGCAALHVAHLIDLVTPRTVFAPMLDALSDYPSIVVEAAIIVVLIRQLVHSERRHTGRRVLAIGAHPDDIEIACGGALARLHHEGYQVRGLVLTNGERGGDANVRPAEARRSASLLGMSGVDVLGFADTRLGEQSLEVLAAIETALNEFDPDIIFTHSANDVHQDHQAVHEATLRAARNHSTILCYESPSATFAFAPTVFIDIGEHLTTKIRSIQSHADQKSKSYVQSERVRGAAVFRGSQAKLRYAEGFEVVRALFTTLEDMQLKAPATSIDTDAAPKVAGLAQACESVRARGKEAVWHES